MKGGHTKEAEADGCGRNHQYHLEGRDDRTRRLGIAVLLAALASGSSRSDCGRCCRSAEPERLTDVCLRLPPRARMLSAV